MLILHPTNRTVSSYVGLEIALFNVTRRYNPHVGICPIAQKNLNNTGMTSTNCDVKSCHAIAINGFWVGPGSQQPLYNCIVSSIRAILQWSPPVPVHSIYVRPIVQQNPYYLDIP